MTFTINESHPQASALVELLKTFSFVSFKETKTKTKKTATKEKSALVEPASRAYNEQQKKFKKMLIEGLEAVEAHKKGTVKFQSLEEVLKGL